MMIIQVEPTLAGMADQVALVYDVSEARPFRLTLSTSHLCKADDLYHLAKAVSLILIPEQLVTNGRSS